MPLAKPTAPFVAGIPLIPRHGRDGREMVRHGARRGGRGRTRATVICFGPGVGGVMTVRLATTSAIFPAMTVFGACARRGATSTSNVGARAGMGGSAIQIKTGGV